MKMIAEKDPMTALREEIQLIENRQAIEAQILREQFNKTYESLKPLNIIKNTLRDVTDSQYLKNNIERTVIGMVTGYLAKKVIAGNTHNPIRRIAGVVLQIGVTSVIIKNLESIKSSGLNLFKHIFRGKLKN